ncbi:MAG: DegT/DnrJ/EryC1/StrS family aminotransferase [Clostridia bacterium]|nr:DegT/DnrJ/EryC1/StrS family aminotransferase [Clostridia bacterium]
MHCHILEIISANNNVSFHTPGHKNESGYCRTFPVALTDTTELSCTDDLSSPTGAIACAQRDIADIVGAKRSYITTDGSTSGVMAMLYAAKGRGGKIIVPRNSHKSVWNACAILGLEPVIVQGGERGGVMLPPSPEQIERLICADESISGLMITSPDYYGNIVPLKQYREILKKCGKLLIADGAHGGHLAFCDGGQGYAGAYADMWVDGVHKSMPALTQGAIVHLNDLTLADRLEEGLSIFRTSSPSFPIMASVEYSVKYCDENRQKIAQVMLMQADVRKRIENSGYKVYPSDDWTKLAVDVFYAGIDSAAACQYLEKKSIYAEFNDGRYILFYLSPMTDEASLCRLVSALEEISQRQDVRGCFSPKFLPEEDRGNYGYLNAVNAPCEYIELEESLGRVCAANAGVSPPCIPVVAAGERITTAVISALAGADHCFGLENGKIKVVKL